MIEVIKLICIGMILGVSNVIPGVSGGTMAVVFGVYDRLISVITLDVKKILTMWKFWTPLGVGVGIGVIAFSSLLVSLLALFPIETNWFFIGLIAGSLPLIIKKIQNSCADNVQTPPLSVVAAMLIALACMIVMDTLQDLSFSQTVQTSISIPLIMMLFCSAVLAALAMIIPGISGSFLLLVVGTYTTILTAVSTFNIPLLIPFALGLPVGLLGGAKIVRVLLQKAPAQTYGAILGLIAGSIVIIFPGIAFDIQLLLSFICLGIGYSLAFFSSRGK